MAVTGTTIGTPWKPRGKRAGAAAGVNPLHTVRVGPKVLHERFPGIIVYVRQCARHVRSFRRFCEQNHLGLVVSDDDGGHMVVVCAAGLIWSDFVSPLTAGAWEVLGTAEHLNELSVHPMLINWHKVQSPSVPRQASGAGPEKIRTAKKHKDPKEGVWTMLHNEYREAVRMGDVKKAEELLTRLGGNKK